MILNVYFLVFNVYINNRVDIYLSKLSSTYIINIEQFAVLNTLSSANNNS